MDLPNWVGASGDGRFESRVIPLLVALQHDPGSSDDIRICDFCDHTHEWGVHVTTFARAAPLTDEQVAATRLSHSHAHCWLPTERVLIECFSEARTTIVALNPSEKNSRTLTGPLLVASVWEGRAHVRCTNRAALAVGQ